jgi:type II secretory pathway pseudopilin PulG
MPAPVSRVRGFTLVELLLAMVLALLIGGVAHGLLRNAQRLSRTQAERMGLQENVRVAALVLAGELGGSDLLAIEPGAVTYLADRGGGDVCGVVPGALAEVVVVASSWTSPRAPRSTDSLLVFVESDPGTGSDDAWAHLGIVSVAGRGCPGGQAGIALRVAVPVTLDPAALARITPGSPARLAEVMQMRYYSSGGKSWLGMRSVGTGEAIQPVAGPLADSSAGIRGLTLAYHDASGAPTSDPVAARSVDIALLGVTDRPIHGRQLSRATVDSFPLTTRVALRNAPHP